MNNAEIDRLGLAAHIRRHVFHRHAENLRCRHRMNVQPFRGKSFFSTQLRNIGDVGQQPQLDLAVIGTNELAALGGDKGPADAAARFGSHRNVLEVGVGGGQPPGERVEAIAYEVCTRPVLRD